MLLLLLAGLLGGAAIFVKDWRALPHQNQYVVVGTFSSALLPDVVSVYDVETTVTSLPFQGAVGADVSAEGVADSPQAFRILVRHVVRREAEESFPKAAELLRIKLKSLAVSKVTKSRAYVEELRLQESERKEETSPAGAAERERTAPSEPGPKEAGQDSREDSHWLREQSEKLEQKAEKLERQARLTSLDSPTTSLEHSMGYWACLALWLGALGSLLGALFLNSGPRREPRVAQQGPHRTISRLGNQGARESLGAGTSGIFFQGLRQNLEKAMGRLPSKILVLGSGEGDRSAFTLCLAKNISDSGDKVRLVDFDLHGRSLSRRIGDEACPGVGDLLAHGGQADEFFASVPGTSIEFAPAGTLRVLDGAVSSFTLESLIQHPSAGVTLIDASFSSPLHLLVSRVDLVLCLTRPGNSWNPQEEQVLIALKEARLPIWGVTRGGSQVFPFL